MFRRLGVAVLVLGAGARGQIPANTAAELQALGARAQVIFAGRVAAIDRHDGAGFVEIRFRVDESVRGAPAGGSYVLREWAGLWTAHPQRYVVGERRLMLLTGRSAAGFSAPVGDDEGAIPLVPVGSAESAAPVGADLRWVEARAQRGSATAAAQVRLAVQAGTQDWFGPIAPLALADATARPVPLTAVLTLLGGRAPATVLKGPLRAR